MRRGVRGTAGILVAVGWLLLGGLGAAWGQVPSESDVFVDRGILAYDARQYREALQAFQEALRLHPENVNALYYAGLALMGLEQPAAALESLEQAAALAPADLDVAFQVGVAAFNLQRYEQAEAAFRRVQVGQPRRPNLGYYLGFLEYRRQNYREALRLFRANVASDEQFGQLNRFYAGLTLSALGFAGQARAEIEQAIRLQPVSPLTGPAERFREVLGTAAKAQRNYRLNVKAGFFYDDNVAAIPRRNDDLLATAARDQKHRSTGELLYARFEYQPFKAVDWETSLSYGLLQNLYNDLVGFNTQTHSLAATASYKTALFERPTTLGLAALYDYGRLDDRDYYNRYTLAPSATFVWSANHVTQAAAALVAKDYMHEKRLITSSDSRDAVNTLIGLTHFIQSQGGDHYLKFGYQLDYEAAQGNNWSYLGNRFVAGFGLTLPWELKFRYDFDVHFRGYTHKHTFLPVGIASPTTRREDVDMYHTAALWREFPGNLTAALEYLRNADESNFPIYDYVRNVVTLSLSWRY